MLCGLGVWGLGLNSEVLERPVPQFCQVVGGEYMCMYAQPNTKPKCRNSCHAIVSNYPNHRPPGVLSGTMTCCVQLQYHPTAATAAAPHLCHTTSNLNTPPQRHPCSGSDLMSHTAHHHGSLLEDPQKVGSKRTKTLSGDAITRFEITTGVGPTCFRLCPTANRR
jgi:hypothetical protein